MALQSATRTAAIRIVAEVRLATAHWRGALYGCGLALLVACTEQRDHARPVVQFGDGQSRERTLDALTWTQRFTIGGLADDTLLQQPARLVADDRGVVVLDAMARRVLSFGTDGQLQWSYGRAGAGPDEFQSPQDLKLDGEGRVWVLDPSNARITVLTRGGEVMRRIPLDRLRSIAHQFVPLAGAEAIVITANPNAPFVHLAADGQVLDELEFPWSGFAELHPLASQLMAGNASDTSDRWVAAFQMGNGFFTFGGARPLGAGAQYVEHVDFPRVVHEQDGNRTASTLDRPRLAARSLSVGETEVHVLFQGDSDVRGRVVDRYALETGEYLGSWLLPRTVTRAAVHGRRVYGIFSDPYPTIAVWEIDMPAAVRP